MSIIEVFFWFCKEQKIMDIIFKIYHSKNIGIWKYEPFTHFKPTSLSEFLDNRILNYGFYDVFWSLQLVDSPFTQSPRYKKARSKWNTFAKNNIMFSDKFIKIGDKVEINTDYGTVYSGTVIGFPKEFSGALILSNDEGREYTGNILGCKQIIVNGVEKKPEFYIKRRRKIYGANKR